MYIAPCWPLRGGSPKGKGHTGPQREDRPHDAGIYELANHKYRFEFKFQKHVWKAEDKTHPKMFTTETQTKNQTQTGLRTKHS